jgi:hypothetical protein
MGRTAFHQTDGYGRVLDPCPNCGHEVPVPRIRVSVHPDLLLPEITEGQLRCQGCAKGVDGDVRFCGRCTAERAAKAEADRQDELAAEREAQRFAEFHARRAEGTPTPVPEAAPRVAPPASGKRPRRYQSKPCANDACRRPFTPTGPRQIYCSPPCKGGK